MLRSAALALVLSSTAALAEAPKVVTDILPVHNLVAAVMGDLGTPSVIVQPGTSPHSASLRPSQARDLKNADLVVRIGPGLTPWFETSAENLATSAQHIILLDLEGTRHLAPRENALFEQEDHHGENEHHGDEEHHEDAHDDAHKDDHADAHDHGHDHGKGGIDPHAWLDPDNAILWAENIAEALARIDADNADTYRANAATLAGEISAAATDVKQELAPLATVPFTFYHDAFQYFDTYFGLQPLGAILPGDAEAASAGRVQDIQAAMQGAKNVCIFSEPQYPARLAEALGADVEARISVLDPLGSAVATDGLGYPALLRSISQNISTCLTGSS